VANWDKHKPSLPIEELKKRIAQGLENWKARGFISKDWGQKLDAAAGTKEPTFDRAGMKRVMQCADIAIAALAQGHRQDYVEAVRVINATRRLAGFPTRFMQTMCDGIADAAAIASGEPREQLDRIARTWLAVAYQPSSRLISLPSKGANDDGQEDREAPEDAGGRAARTDEEGSPGGGPGDQPGQAPGAAEEPEREPGEGGQGAG